MARTIAPPAALEIIEKGHADDYTTPTLIFVHGACHAAWCWRNFQEWFARHGYHTVALSLRGHGGSAGHEHLQQYGIRDYVDDVERVVREKIVDRPFVLIGHSLGGGIVQGYLWRLLATDPPPRPEALVLMGAITPGIMRKALFNMRFIAPYVRPRGLWSIGIKHDLYAILARDRFLVRTSFFQEDTDEEAIASCQQNLGPESWRAVTTLFRLPSPAEDARIRVLGIHVCVLGAEKDGLLPPELILAAARAYGGTCQVFSNRGHDLMLDQGWEEVAVWLADWIGEQVRGSPPR